MESLPLHVSSLERIWKGKKSLETFTLEQHDAGFIADGIVYDSTSNIRYQVCTDLNWGVLKVCVEDLDRFCSTLELNRAADNLWYDENGIELTDLAGCQLVDISASPFTNTIAVQNMGGSKYKSFKVLYIAVPGFNCSVVEQHYTDLGSGKFRYENLNNHFSAELLVDQYGLLVDYPGLFKVL